MKNILKNVFIGGLAFVSVLSCDMDMKPTTSIVFDEDVPMITGQSDIDGLYSGVLASFRAVQYGAFTQSSEVMCDGFNALIGFGNNYGSIHRTDASFTTSDQYAETMWASHYSAIKNYNIAIEEAEKVTDEELKPYADLLIGTAMFCRASSYLTLARHFGPAYDEATAEEDDCVPLVLVYDQYAKPKRASVMDVYDQIGWDLDDAYEYLKNVEIQGQPQYPFVSLDAINAMRARYYLDIKDYDNAADYANDIIDSKVYKLSTSAAEMDAEYLYDSGEEPIMQLYASMSEGLVSNPIYTQVSTDRKGKYFQPYFIPSQKLIDAYESADIRFQKWFSSSKYPVFTNGARYNGVYVFIKYFDSPRWRTGQLETGAHAAKPLMISEMYLIAAEALCMDRKSGQAKMRLNQLQDARGATPTDASMENIKKEWFRETVGEGMRMTCLKRWGDGFDGRPSQPKAEGIVMTGEYFDERKIVPGDYVFNWPIPSYEFKLNHNLEQNAGYGSK